MLNHLILEKNVPETRDIPRTSGLFPFSSILINPQPRQAPSHSHERRISPIRCLEGDN
jgi:hypothetical protein